MGFYLFFKLSFPSFHSLHCVPEGQRKNLIQMQGKKSRRERKMSSGAEKSMKDWQRGEQREQEES